MMASATGQTNSLLFLRDTISGRQFLVDTGAEVSVLPATSWIHVQRNQDHRCWQPMAAPSKLMVHAPFPVTLPPTSTSGLSPLLMFLALCWEQIFSAQTLS